MIIIINGMPGSGKDTFVDCCTKILNESQVANFSTVDLVKRIAKEAGWDGTKSPNDRKFLSSLKQLLTEWNEAPLHDIQKKISNFYNNYSEFYNPEEKLIFIHCREPEEIDKLKKHSGDLLSWEERPIAIIIRRDAIENCNQSNNSDQNVFDYNYDYEIDNNGSIDDLMETAHGFLTLLGF